MRIAIILATVLPCVAFAGDWIPMSGVEIADTLAERDVVYENASQRFYASGRTSYDSGSESWGTWEVRGDQYCSQWPPSAGWACYDMEMDVQGGMIRFVGESGDETDGRLLARE